MELFAKAGTKFFGLGIEVASQVIRKEITKGKFENVDVRNVIKQVRDYGISPGCNYMMGFENEKLENLQETYDLAEEINGEFTNIYCATALPGSELYWTCKDKGWELPETLSGYSFHSYDHVPLRTNYLTAAEVLQFRDDSWNKFFSRPSYHDMIEKKWGLGARKSVEDMCKIKLRRKLLGHAPPDGIL